MHTVKDSFPLPRTDEVLDSLHSARWFSTMDLLRRYWEIRMEDESKEKAAFTTPHKLYQFKVLPFELCNALGLFQKLMQHILRDHISRIYLIYMDDVIIYSSNFEQHLEDIKVVFDAIRVVQLQLKLFKGKSGTMAVEFLGHVVSREGIYPSKKNITAVTSFPKPQATKDVRAFLGLCMFYRKFIKEFGWIAGPLYSLLKKGVCLAGAKLNKTVLKN